MEFVTIGIEYYATLLRGTDSTKDVPTEIQPTFPLPLLSESHDIRA